MNRALLQRVESKLVGCNDWQLKLIDLVITSLINKVTCNRTPGSDVVTLDFALAFGEVLKLHHCLSSQYLDKNRFEASMEQIYRDCGIDVKRPKNKCNPGHDITVSGIPWSLKTQGDAAIKADVLHISKFMELGKGIWKDKVEDLYKLRDRFVTHMASYERILQLRYFRGSDCSHYYELVEIPKTLLKEAEKGVFAMFAKSKQDPKPGVCRVFDKTNVLKFNFTLMAELNENYKLGTCVKTYADYMQLGPLKLRRL